MTTPRTDHGAAGLWAYVRERRALREQRQDLRRASIQGAICVLAAIVAGAAMLAGGEMRPLYELAGRFTVGAAVYCAIVFGVKHGAPQLWNGPTRHR